MPSRSTSSVLCPHPTGALWSINLDYGPAPPPECGPPISADASRNKALLKYQIPGICGSYVVIALIIGFLILTVGRRARKAALRSASDRSREMVKPATRALDLSPTLSQRSWSSPKNLIHGFQSKDETKQSVVASSQPVASFDNKVVEQDKLDRQQEMERLYAAVMAGEIGQQPAVEDTGPQHVRQISNSSFSQPFSPNRSNTNVSGTSTQAPAAAVPAPAPAPRKDIRAIYPPDRPLPNVPETPRSPIRADAQISNWTTSKYVPPPSPYSPASSTHSKKSKSSQKTIRGLTISGPIQKYPASNDEEDDIDASTPLTPRFYNPGPPPSPPIRSPPYDHDHDDGNDSDIVDDYETEDLDEPRPLPHPAPQRSFSYRSDASTLNNGTEPSHSRATQPRDLPLRGLTHNAYLNPLSPKMQTTIIEQRQHHYAHGPPNGMWSAVSNGPPNGMWSASLGAQRSGLMSPHSPYMPFSPVTPVTPHLQTKSERKQRKKENVRKAVTEEDGMVPDEKDMWGDAY